MNGLRLWITQVCGSSENILPKMALMITLHHKYVQLSSSNLAFPICSTVGLIMMLGIWASISIILQYTLFVMLCGLHEQQHNCNTYKW